MMSEAAVSKRIKNLEEYIGAKKKQKDREDAVSHASQVIDSMSKADQRS
jgi:hypothetical protein